MTLPPPDSLGGVRSRNGAAPYVEIRARSPLAARLLKSAGQCTLRRVNPAAAGVLSSSPMADLRRAVQPIPGLMLLVLFGSRARAEAAADSDWDLGFLGEAELDQGLLIEAVTRAVGTDRVDLVDLSRATALLRFRAARDGVPVFECAPDRFLGYQEEASLAWCDLEPVLRRAYGGVLEDLVGR